MFLAFLILSHFPFAFFIFAMNVVSDNMHRPHWNHEPHMQEGRDTQALLNGPGPNPFL